MPRPDDASSFEEQASDHMIEAPTTSYHEEPYLPDIEPLSGSNTNNSYSGFPPSFSQMLTNCSTQNAHGKLIPHEDSHTIFILISLVYPPNNTDVNQIQRNPMQWVQQIMLLKR